ncbi:hypothetical protein OHB54_46640 (plasmid) [Streptomyces sp. NBC_01007]|nr:hypothetical protein OHB54_46640 [Streptomyces sp. NBC_01007]
MEVTGVGIVAFLVFLLAPEVGNVLKSIAFRIRAAGKAELLRAEREPEERPAGRGRAQKRGRRD